MSRRAETPDWAALRDAVEVDTLAEIERVGVQSLNKNAVAKRFAGRGASPATVYRWVDAAAKNRKAGQHFMRLTQGRPAREADRREREQREAGPGNPLMHRIEDFALDDIRVGKRIRPLNHAAVQHLAQSIERVGLRMPISLCIVDGWVDEDGVLTTGVPLLVAGYHRLEACRLLGWNVIRAEIVIGSALDFRLWEIAENLHRYDLSPVERAEHVAEWVRLTEKGALDASQLATHEPRRAGQQPGGINAASRELGISKDAAHRAMKIASLPQAVRDQAREEVWSQKRLLEAVSSPKPAPPAPTPRNDIEALEAWVAIGMRWWNRGSKDWRDEFLRRVTTTAAETGKSMSASFLTFSSIQPAITSVPGGGRPPEMPGSADRPDQHLEESETAVALSPPGFLPSS